MLTSKRSTIAAGRHDFSGLLNNEFTLPPIIPIPAAFFWRDLPAQMGQSNHGQVLLRQAPAGPADYSREILAVRFTVHHEQKQKGSEWGRTARRHGPVNKVLDFCLDTQHVTPGHVERIGPHRPLS
jgi:hypothetical protein